MSIGSLAELREAYISFMAQRGYLRITADRLISDAFPTTFNVSGGPNFVDHYLDEGKREGENSVTIQHCLRHWDYANAGDGLHLSFFEMGVTTAFNGYPQDRVFGDHLTFILEHLGYPQRISILHRLWWRIGKEELISEETPRPKKRGCLWVSIRKIFT